MKCVASQKDSLIGIRVKNLVGFLWVIVPRWNLKKCLTVFVNFCPKCTLWCSCTNNLGKQKKSNELSAIFIISPCFQFFKKEISRKYLSSPSSLRIQFEFYAASAWKNRLMPLSIMGKEVYIVERLTKLRSILTETSIINDSIFNYFQIGFQLPYRPLWSI